MSISEQDLVGAWRLVSAVEVYSDGERRPEFGPAADGYLSYSPDGIVSATLGSTRRPPSEASDPQRASDDDLVRMARDFIAYAGPFTVDSAGDTVTHHIDVSTAWGMSWCPPTATGVRRRNVPCSISRSVTTACRSRSTAPTKS
ncbi:lipocalin-like domain-containing protein [Paractinoplanes hotanensis]|uniref:lipocalin-like domain-containing protein n=1 Tax=Paractinoplanes hotanensis TaxID=2906497 RepID=UPI0034DB4827